MKIKGLFLAASLVLSSSAAFAASLNWDGSNTGNAAADGGAGTWDNATTANWWNGSSDVQWTDTTGVDTALFGGTAGTVTLSGGVTANALNFSIGGYTLTGGTLTLAGTSPTVTATAGTTQIDSAIAGAGFTFAGAGNITFGGSVSNTFGGTLTLNTAGGTTSRSIIFAKTGGAKAVGDGAVVNFGTGTATQDNLRMGASDQFGSGVVLNFNNTSGNWVRFDMKGTNQTLAGVTSVGGGIIQNQGIDVVVPATNSTLTLNGAGSYVFNGYIRDQDDSGTSKKIAIVKNGSGTQTFQGGNILYTGDTAVNSGTLKLVDANAYRSGTTTIASGAVLEMNTAAGSLSATNGGTAIITGTGSFQKTGAGVMRLGQSGTAVRINMSAGGQIDVQAGTLEFGFAQNGMGANLGSMNVASGAKYYNSDAAASVDALTGGGTVGNAYSANVFTLTVGVSGTTNNATYGVTGNTAAFSGIIKDQESYNSVTTANAAVIKTGSGTQIFTGANAYHGGTTISGGKLVTGHTSALGLGAVNVNTAGATLQVGDGTVNTVTLGSGATLAVANGALLKLGAFNAASLDGAAGVVTLAGAGTYTFNTSGKLDLNFVLDGITSGTHTYNLIAGGNGVLGGGELQLANITGYGANITLNSFANGTLSFTAVPEPSTYGLIGAGALAGVAFVRRRRRHAGKVAA